MVEILVMTNAEFWGTMAETLKGYGVMPYDCPGLCAVLYLARVNGLIGWAQYANLRRQLARTYGKLKYTGHGAFYWRPNSPRIKACRVLMQEAK